MRARAQRRMVAQGPDCYRDGSSPTSKKSTVHVRWVSMCFSPWGDLVGGAAVVGIGVDACLHLKGRFEFGAIAALPIALGLHQMDESLVWWWLQGHVSHTVGQVATWIYLIFALVILPTLVPLLVLFFMP